MFDSIAHRYDLLNRVLSLGIDVSWRKKLVSAVSSNQPQAILDVATGTGDVALMMVETLEPRSVIGIDIAKNMLEIGREKAIKRDLAQQISFLIGDSENMEFANNTFDAVTVAFGVRNFEHTLLGLEECYRVLKPGGRFAVLEFSKPMIVPFRQVFQLYFRYILPIIGRLTSKDPKAYHYLFESVQSFPEGKAFTDLMEKAGFLHTSFQPLTLGICTLYWGDK
ncbi:MAG: bifunctional demethylmenaquinone methyltransferase/2-methoxy-6-polyprenyl-1,4-benzoquinol methylase UbiE [Saprospiraceae bacterium]|nr:bifunctional demethylmenaquinone methyltransferase/2-methoxy-6-polyprenyl-1,4-benzoquinol methylase UbiE [Saprospiraceae bacterium]